MEFVLEKRGERAHVEECTKSACCIYIYILSHHHLLDRVPSALTRAAASVGLSSAAPKTRGDHAIKRTQLTRYEVRAQFLSNKAMAKNVLSDLNRMSG